MPPSPSYYSCNIGIGNSSTGAVTEQFGFGASTIRLLNLESVDIYARLDGNPATTRDMCLYACRGEVTLSGLPEIRTISAVTTSTSASDKLLRCTALGG